MTQFQTAPLDSQASVYDRVFQEIQSVSGPKKVLENLVKAIHREVGPRANVRLATRGLRDGHYRITRLMTDDGCEHGPQADWGAPLGAFPAQTGGFLSQVICDNAPKVLQDLHLENDSVLGNLLAPYRSGLAIPLHSAVHPGDWLIVLERDERAFDLNDLTDGLLRTHLIGMALDNLHLRERLGQANAEMERHFAQMARVQQGLMPPEYMALPGCDVAFWHEPYYKAGGDYCDFVLSGSSEGSQEWSICLADVPGHGPACSAMLGILYAMFHQNASEGLSPGQTLAKMNDAVLRWNIPDVLFVPAWTGVLLLPEGKLTYASAGHHMPLFRHGGDATVGQLRGTNGIVLGALADSYYAEDCITLGPGAALALYTDGLTEAHDQTGRMWKTDGLRAAFKEAPGEAQASLAHCRDAYWAHLDGARPEDDCTLAILQRR